MAIKREKVVKQAEKLVAKGKIEGAIKEYRKVLAENPNDANTLNRVGDLYARIERFDEAVKLFSQIADQYSRDGFFVKAIAIYKKIIKLSPTSLQVYERLAELYFKQGLINEARSQFQILADHYEKRDNAASAITIYQRMAEIDPENPGYYLKLAQLFQAQQLTDKALGAYRQLSDLLLVSGSVDEAVQVYVKAIEAYPAELDFVRSVSTALHSEGHGEAAEKVLSRAQALNPKAEAIAQDLFGQAEMPAELDPVPEPAAVPPPSAATEIPVELPTVEPEPEPEPVPAPTPPPVVEDSPQDDSFFTLDLDTDETPDTQVRPPEDMLDGAMPAAPEDEFEIDLGGDDSGGMLTSTSAAAEEAAQASIEPASTDEDDWSPDEFEDEIPIEIEIEDELEVDLEASDGFAELEPDLQGASEAGAPAALETPPRHEDDLLAEAKVFAKYGLREKAEDRLHELLQARPEHLGGLCLLAKVELDAGQHQEAREKANAAARVAQAGNVDLGPWNDLREDFAQAGYELEDFQVTAEPEPKPDRERFAQLLEELDETGSFVPEALREAMTPVDDPLSDLELPELDAPSLEDEGVRTELEVAEPGLPAPDPAAIEGSDVEGRATGVGEAAAKPGARTKPFQAPKGVGDETVSLEAPLFEEEAELFGEAESAIFDEEPVEAAPAGDEAASVSEIEALMERARQASGFEELVPESMPLDGAATDPATTSEDGASAGAKVQLAEELGLDELAEAPMTAAQGDASEDDETGMSWLDDPATGTQEEAAKGESIFDEEDDFFDLASELEAEMEDEERGLGEVIPLESQEQSLQEIIDGFKKGVADNLSSEDYDTHFNLGIAYREMGLLDEAIGEFQLAAKDPRYLVESTSMLGVCFLDKGLPELAVKWYRKGLESPAIAEDQALGLLYDMASCYLHMNDYEAAYRAYVEIYGMSSNYRDVAQRIQEMNEYLQQTDAV